MARKVKLQDTGECTTSDKAWKAPNGKYWSSESVYNKYSNNNTYRQKSIDFICEKLNAAIVPTYLCKRLKDFPDYEVVYETLVDQEKVIDWAIENKGFNKEINAIQYIMAIVSNTYNDTEKVLKHKKELLMKQTKITETYEEVDIDNIGLKNQKGNGVGSLLGSADWI